ncbi:MAG: hypothetical protein WDW36_002265 [Sanguina aurantia]
MVHLQRLLAVCGSGYQGRLGLGFPAVSEGLLRVVPGLIGHSVESVSCGGAHTAVLTKDGSLFTFGLNDKGQLGHSSEEKFVTTPVEVSIPDPVKVVAAGEFHTLCLTRTGDVWAFGASGSGQLGLGSSAADTPRQVEPRLVKALQGVRVVGLAAGVSHSLALTAGGDVLSWGCGESGQLGHGSAGGKLLVETEPRVIRTLNGHHIQSITAGFHSSGCIDDKGRPFTWGHGLYWQLGQGKDQHELVPTQLAGPIPARSLSIGHMHSIASREPFGQLHLWGTDDSGTLGQGEGVWANRPIRVPTPIKVKTPVVQVAAGWRHSAAVTSEGRLLTWGWSGSYGLGSSEEIDGGGHLGHGNELDCWGPTEVQRVKTSATKYYDLRIPQQKPWKALQVDCGRNHTAVVIEAEVKYQDFL